MIRDHVRTRRLRAVLAAIASSALVVVAAAMGQDPAAPLGTGAGTATGGAAPSGSAPVASAPTVASAGAVDPSSPLDTLRAAERAYEEGMSLLRQDPAQARRRFEESARLYAVVRDAGSDNASLHFNLGNAQLQAGRVGEAIASYLRAQRTSPGETRVQRNLAHARSLVSERFERVGATTLLENVASWWHIAPLPVRWWAAIGCWVALWTLVLLRALRPTIMAGEGTAIAWRWSVGAAAIGVLLAGGTVTADAVLDRWRPRGVIVEHGVVVRKGNGEGFEPQFQESLGEGVEFRVRDRRPGWVEIELPNGRGGWIRAGDASLI